MEWAKIHEWTNCLVRDLLREHYLNLRGVKGKLMEHVKVHFLGLYLLSGVCY